MEPTIQSSIKKLQFQFRRRLQAQFLKRSDPDSHRIQSLSHHAIDQFELATDVCGVERGLDHAVDTA